jgi:L-lactate dehydrogenase complex protein LldG
MSSARDEILARIRAALQKPDEHIAAEPDWNAQLYTDAEAEDWIIRFAQVFESRSGKFHFVEHPDAFFDVAKALVTERGWQRIACYDTVLQQWLQEADIAYDATDELLTEAQVSFTFCDTLMARTGSVFVSSMLGGGRRLTIFPPIHVVVAFASQVVPDIAEGISYVRQLYPDGLPSLLSLTTGPSRTADIEKTLVLGAHGPKEIHVILVDDLAE